MRDGILRPMRPSRWLRTLVVAVLAPAAATVLALQFRGGRESAASLYLLAVVVASAAAGLWAGLASSLLSFLGLNYFFTPPRETLAVNKTEDLVALVVFLIVAVVVATLLSRAIDERARASRREREASLLNYFATKLLQAEPLDRQLQDLAIALLPPFDLVRAEITARVAGREVRAEGSRPGEEGARQAVPIVGAEDPVGMLVVVRRAGLGGLSEADERLLSSCARQIAVALERERLDLELEEHRASSETSEIRAALFSSVTHDLRTPLASIKASVTSLLGDEAAHDERQRHELLQTVLEETDWLNRLLGNILDLAKVRAGTLVPAKEPTAVEDVVESVLHRLTPMLARLRVRTLVRPDLPDVPADPVQLDQVLTNLLENAARFSPPSGEIQISVAEWQGAVRVSVADHGPGIPLDEREHVFEAFYRHGDEGGRSGSGLGLAIAKAIVLAHGGRIWVEGTPGGGATVLFDLPVLDAEPVAQERLP